MNDNHTIYMIGPVSGRVQKVAKDEVDDAKKQGFVPVLVVNPADPAVIDRVARILVQRAHDYDGTDLDGMPASERDTVRDVSRDVLAALSAEAKPTLGGDRR